MWTGWDVPIDEGDVPDQFPGPAASEGRHSIKRLFCALALARDVSFAMSYDILHFIYDLHLWTMIGSKRS
eukprot:10097318-Karenia_brevis.AAC.1